MVKPNKKIKLSKNLKPFVSNVVRAGKVQRAFAVATQLTQQCVSTAIKVGDSSAEIRRKVADCAQANMAGKKFGELGVMGWTPKKSMTTAEKEDLNAKKKASLGDRFGKQNKAWLEK